MPRRVKIAPGHSNVSLPNNLTYESGDEVILSDEEFSALTPSQIGVVVLDLGTTDGPSGEELDALATDAEVAAAIAAIPTPDLSSKQDAATAATDAELAAAQAADDARLDTLEAAPAGEASPFTDQGVIVSADDTNASWVVGSDRMDRDPADATKDTRTFFNKVKGAFRAGVASTQWDDSSVGAYSAAFGTQNIASGSGSFASGSTNTASGANSHAEGVSCSASNNGAHAEGFDTTASGSYSHAENFKTDATGNYSHAEGDTALASGTASHAEGTSTTASGASSHAQGQWSQASGSHSHAQGYNSIASGTESDASGRLSTASRKAQRSHAAGMFAAPGDAQTAELVLRQTTTDATPNPLHADPSVAIALTGASTSVLTLTASRAFQLKISAVARRTNAQGEMAGWTWEGLVGRDSTGSARIIGTPIEAAWGDLAADPWTLAVSIDTTDATNNYVKVTATGEAGKTIRWVAKMEWVEVAG